MAPVDIIIDIIERKQKAIWEKTEGVFEADEDGRIQASYDTLEELKNDLEGLKKLFS